MVTQSPIVVNFIKFKVQTTKSPYDFADFFKDIYTTKGPYDRDDINNNYLKRSYNLASYYDSSNVRNSRAGAPSAPQPKAVRGKKKQVKSGDVETA